MAGKLFKSGSGLAFIIPKDLAECYHLKAGTLVDATPLEDGLLLKPVELIPRLSKEWERALDSVVEKYGLALQKLGE